MKKVYLSLLLVVACLAGFAQSNSLDFVGTVSSGSYVSVPNSATLTMGNELTIEAWVNIPGPEMGNILLKGSYGWGVLIGNDGCSAGNKLNYWVTAACPSSITSTGTIPYGVWTHIAVVVTTFPTKSVEFFINGVSSGTSNSSTITINDGLAGDLIIGRQGTSCNCNFFNGSMDEVRIWSVARTQPQIMANMLCDIMPQAGLQAYYRFDQGIASGTNTGYTTVQDYSGNNNCGTLNGFALTGSTSNFVAGMVPSCNPIASTVPEPTNSGTKVMCAGQTTTLSNGVSGGTWSSSNALIASVNPTTGVVTGVAGGTANITYSLSCGTAVSVVTVNAVATISNSSNLCMGSDVTFTPSLTGGTWSSSNTSIVTVGSSSGVVSPVSEGTANIIYVATNSCTTTKSVVVNGQPSVMLSTVNPVCAGGTSTTLSFSGANNIISKTVPFGFTGGAQTWTVPAGVTSITVDAQGAAGGLNADNVLYTDMPGYGGRVQAQLTVTPGQVLNIYVGGQGNDGTPIAGGPGGYNGGGNGAFGYAGVAAGGGGGATDIRINGTALTDRVLVAAGGGGAGLNCGGGSDNGGNGGGLAGQDGSSCFSFPFGMGGTQFAGGAAGGGATPGSLGMGGDGQSGSAGGGGGAGYYGGGGAQWAGGGGGSSYTDAVLASSVVHTQGANSGAGMLTITYSIPTTYGITWDAGALSEGFTNVSSSAITSSPVTIAVPGTAATGNYTGTLTMTNTNTGCSTPAYSISLDINPIPDVDPISSQTVCNTATTTAINYTGSVSGTTYNWENSDATIGVGPTGTGDIAAFPAANTSNVPVISVFTVTPTRLGCVGAVETFSITVNPTPNVNASSNQAVCNGSAITAVYFSGPVAGTSYNWTASDTTIGIDSAGTDSIGVFTGTNTTPDIVTSVITVNTTANGCTGGSNSFTITVYPTPTLSSGTNAPAICDNTLFSYTPTSLTAGTTFDWSRDAVTGITNPAATGTDDPSEILMNTTTDPINVIYTYTLTANGCPNTENVTVVVNPTPVLSSPLTPAAVCDSTLFSYTHASLTVGTTYTWSRAAVTGIANADASGAGDINETLDNTTPDPINVTYIDTLVANGCMNIQAVTVAVNPTPMLSTPTVMSAICDSSNAFYVPASLTTGTTYNWSRAVLTGIANPAGSGADTISETLYNTSVNPINVVYTYTLTANGCPHTEQVSIVVNPTPVLSSAVTPPAVCDSDLFNYTPMSATLGSTFAWERPFVLGIGLTAGSGTGNPNEQLINNTHSNLNVVYTYTLVANGCTHRQNVTVVVHPTPTLSSVLATKTCSNERFSYVPTGYTFGTTFTWTRDSVASITPAKGLGSGTVNEVLVNGTLSPKTTAYKFILTANGCTNVQYVTVTVNPAPAAPIITTFPPSALCGNTMYQNFGTSMMPPAGQEFEWSATNATVWATGQGGQYALVNFTQPGESWVTVKSNVTGFSCTTPMSYKVTVGTTNSDVMKVVYFDGQLVCLDPNQDSYQWGYDDGITLDSTIVAGEKNPNYFISGADFKYRHYWVITKHGDCIQKTYYNAPLGIADMNTAELGSIRLYPNPASNLVNVDINTTLQGAYELDVVNLLGQQMHKEVVNGQKATINVAEYAAGIYLVDCYQNGVKIATQRFIKN